MQHALTAVTLADLQSFVNVGDDEFPDAAADAPPAIRLLPHFDPYLIGSFPRDFVFPGAAADRALARGQAGTHPVLLIDGVRIGTIIGLHADLTLGTVTTRSHL